VKADVDFSLVMKAECDRWIFTWCSEPVYGLQEKIFFWRNKPLLGPQRLAKILWNKEKL